MVLGEFGGDLRILVGPIRAERGDPRMSLLTHDEQRTLIGERILDRLGHRDLPRTVLVAGKTLAQRGAWAEDVADQYGYAVEYGMEQQVRAALAPPIYGGSNEIQRNIVAKAILGL